MALAYKKTWNTSFYLSVCKNFAKCPAKAPEKSGEFMDTGSWSNINSANYFYKLWQPVYERKKKNSQGVHINYGFLAISETMQI